MYVVREAGYAVGEFHSVWDKSVGGRMTLPTLPTIVDIDCEPSVSTQSACRVGVPTTFRRTVEGVERTIAVALVPQTVEH